MKRGRYLSKEEKLSSQAWALAMFGKAEMPDIRLNERLIYIASRFASKPNDSIPQGSGDWAEAKATYRFIENNRIKVESMEKSVARGTAERCIGLKAILAIQDTTTLSFNNLKKAEGLGPVNDNINTKGIFCHSTLAVTPEGLPIGLLNQQYWCREYEDMGKSEKRKRLPIEEKESVKWIQGIRSSHRVMKEFVKDEEEMPYVIHVFDREGDIYDVFQEIISRSQGAVIRSSHNRKVDEIDLAHKKVRETAVLGRRTIDVPRKKGQKARKAKVELRSIYLSLTPGKQKPSLKLNLVEVWEPNPPEEAEQLHWLLWTTEPIETFDNVLYVLSIYRKRWLIEEVHMILKSGCGVEKLQMETAERLIKVISIYLPIAVRILQIKVYGREKPEAPCTIIFHEDEWRTLWIYINKKPALITTEIPTLRQMVLWIGRMGGHLGRKRDSMPGVRVLWRGYRDLQLLTEFYRSQSAYH